MFKEIWGGVPAKRVSWETQRSTKAGVGASAKKGFLGNPTFNESWGWGLSKKGFLGNPTFNESWGWGLSKKGFLRNPTLNESWGYIIEGINEFCPIFNYIVSI